MVNTDQIQSFLETARLRAYVTIIDRTFSAESGEISTVMAKIISKAWEIECVSGVFVFTLHAKSMWHFTNSRWGRNRKTVSALPKSIAKEWPEADLDIFTKISYSSVF